MTIKLPIMMAMKIRVKSFLNIHSRLIFGRHRLLCFVIGCGTWARTKVAGVKARGPTN